MNYKKMLRKAEKKVGWKDRENKDTIFYHGGSYNDACSSNTSSDEGYLDRKEEESRIKAAQGEHCETKISRLKGMMDYLFEEVLQKQAETDQEYTRQNKEIRKLQKEVSELKEVVKMMSHCFGVSSVNGDQTELLKQWRNKANKIMKKQKNGYSLVDYCKNLHGKGKN